MKQINNPSQSFIGINPRQLSNDQYAAAQYEATSAGYNHMAPFPQSKPFNWAYLLAPIIIGRVISNFFGEVFGTLALAKEIESYSPSMDTPVQYQVKCGTPGCFCDKTDWETAFRYF